MGKNKKSNWDQLRKKDFTEDTRYRDVYEDQQLDRSSIDDPKSDKPWLVFIGICSVVSVVPVYYGIQLVKGTMSSLSGLMAGEGLSDFVRPEGFSIQAAFWAGATGLIVFAAFSQTARNHVKAQNMMSDTSDINQYKNDQHIALPEEVMRKYDWFPDVGAHSNVQPSSMISHVALSNKGLKPIYVAKRTKQDVLDENGNVILYKGEPLTDDDGYTILEKKPLIDDDFAEALFTASGAPDDKNVRKRYTTKDIDYNSTKGNLMKLKYDTVADLINNDWEFPEFEPQRPAGAYIVDTDPVNTMVLAITRAGKGQTYIESMIDMWSRELQPNNMVVNDPKGELLRKNYVRGTVRGYQIVQFNLINAMRTDIYNPLGLAADAAREGDFTKCAMYVENIADVFFPVDGGDDPVWPNAANNAFKRAAYGLIDFYLEEEKELRLTADSLGKSQGALETEIDEMWGKVTLYNCYQLFVQLTSKKLKPPNVTFKELYEERTKPDVPGIWYSNYVMQDENGDNVVNPDSNMTHEHHNTINAIVKSHKDLADRKAPMWEESQNIDLLTLYFNATDRMPRNSMRTLVANANNALKAMAGAEKMMASVYGIAITAMSFFTDPTISTLTSGTPSQNVDLAGMSFPRRLGVRLHSTFIEKYKLKGMQVKWDAFSDDKFTDNLGKDFEHEDMISREGWCKYYFKGKFPNDVAYVRLRIFNTSTGMLINEFFFKFTKAYQMTLNARSYVEDPVLGERIVKNGTLEELKFDIYDKMYVPGKIKFKNQVLRISDFNADFASTESTLTPAIMRTMVRYSEKPKMVFLVTPPHLMKYAKLILILLKQLVDLNFDQSYMTKSSQKPLYKTRFMLDELGNLQSEGHGISGFETMLSIGLGQEQQFSATCCVMKSYAA